MQIHAPGAGSKTVLLRQLPHPRDDVWRKLQLHDRPAPFTNEEMTRILRHVQDEVAGLAQHPNATNQTGILKHHQGPIHRGGIALTSHTFGLPYRVEIYWLPLLGQEFQDGRAR